MSWGLLSVAEKDLCKLIYAFFKLIFIAIVADFKPFFYRCAFHGVANDVFQNQGIVPFPKKGDRFAGTFPIGRAFAGASQSLSGYCCPVALCGTVPVLAGSVPFPPHAHAAFSDCPFLCPWAVMKGRSPMP